MGDDIDYLAAMIENRISLFSPAGEDAVLWCAQVWMFENKFIVEHKDPLMAIKTCYDELARHNLITSSTET